VHVNDLLALAILFVGDEADDEVADDGESSCCFGGDNDDDFPLLLIVVVSTLLNDCVCRRRCCRVRVRPTTTAGSADAAGCTISIIGEVVVGWPG